MLVLIRLAVAWSSDADCGPPGCDDTETFPDLQVWIFGGLALMTTFVIVATVNALLRQRRDGRSAAEHR